MRSWPEMRRYVRFDEADEASLRAALPVVRPHFGRIADDFYGRILEHDATRRLITEGEAQVRRLKGTLARWLEGCFTGPWDEVYFEERAHIGRIHVRIGLEPRYVILAMNLVRWGLQTAVIQGLRGEPDRLFSTMRAVAKICDIELAIMVETYGEEFSLQLKRRERLAAIGQLGASISHEVKNPLLVIASSLFALRDHLGPTADERTAKHLERIQRNVDQANQIVSTLLEFLRTREPARLESDWNALVASASATLHLPPEVRLEHALEAGAGRACVDAAQIGRVIANLVQNAAEASPPGGVVTIATSGEADAVEVTVRDRGQGIPGDAIPQLFEPLFTTKPTGTGLGLALSRAIVEAHGGSIGAANAPGGGALFHVRLPRREQPADGGGGAREATEGPDGS